MKWMIGFLCLMLVACDTGGGSDASDEDLAGALLRLEDVPSGWSIREDGGNDAIQVCSVTSFDELLDPDAEAERSFTAGESGLSVTQRLTAMEFESDAEEGMDHIRDAFGCGEWTHGETNTRWMIAEIAFPDLGEETAAFRFSTTDGTATENGAVVAVRDGGVILLIVHVARGELDSSVTEELIHKAFDRVQDM